MPKKTSKLFILPLFLLFAFNLSAQTTVIMPHLGTDTLVLSQTGCYTILDPGGTGKYQNNEDSYLLILSDNDFYIQAEYEVGHTYDGKDYIDVYYDTSNWYGYERLGGTDKREIHLWTHRAKIHFHSNSYNTFDGFVFRIEHLNTIYNQAFTPIDTQSVHLTWEDSRSEATSWTVYYTPSDDTVLTMTTNSKSATITNLIPGRYYKYWIKNNYVQCMHTYDSWFTAAHDSCLLINPPTWFNTDTLPASRCYHITGPSGDSIMMSYPYQSHTYIFNQRHGVYLRGDYRVVTGEVSPRRRTVWGDVWGDYFYSDRSRQRSYYQWFPEGYVDMIMSGRSRFDFEVLYENDGYLVPTVTNIAATSATISWTDASASTSWAVHYCSDESRWTTVNTTSPTVTISGLQPGRQYIYTIEGNSKLHDCDVAARHAFITLGGNPDTIIMPYRGDTTILLQPRHCYTVLDAGGGNRTFCTDYSRLVLRTANGKGFRVKGRCLINDPDRFAINDGIQNYQYDNRNYDIQFSSKSDSLVLFFQSDVKDNGKGITIEVLQVDDSITNLHTTNIGTTSATVSWTDNSGATAWTVHYGDSEDNFLTVNASSPSATISGLTPGRQYVYYITNANSESSCLFSERRAFITQGLQAGNVLMPYRGIDTLIIQPNSCYKIWDAGGKEKNYFNNDTSVLVIMSSDGSDFAIDGQWLFGGNEALYYQDSYDSYDRVSYQSDPNSNYYWSECDGYYNRFANNDHIRYYSSGGYLRLRFTSNSHTTRPGYCFTVDRSDNQIYNIRATRVTKNSAFITWDDNSSVMNYTISYGPVGGTQYTANISGQRNYTLTGLMTNTDYEVRVYHTGNTPCNSPAILFTTLDANSIVMTYHGDDTVYITPGQCYYVYDPGGSGDYLPSDTSRLVIYSTTGEGFFYNATANVGSNDRSDELWISECGWGRGNFWWGWDRWQWSGNMTIELTTNEALQERGFYLAIRFPSTAFNPDSTAKTDSTLTITWQDTSSATQWNFSYGTDIDSMVTYTTSTKQFTMTGLKQNQQYFYSIYSTLENKDCVLENIYGAVIATDPGQIIIPYRNYYLSHAGRYSLYYNSQITVTPDRCYHVYDVGGIGNNFQNSSSTFNIVSSNSQGLTLEGYYDLGSSDMWISNGYNSSWYGNSGYLKIYSTNGNISLEQRAGTRRTDFAPGFNFDLSFNYKIYNVRTQNMTCTSAQLLWDDSSASTQWTVAYGPTEKQLDTLVVNTKSVSLTNLLPDHQYVCYLTNNDSVLDCLKPVKYCFITTCDTTIFVIPYNKDTTRVLDINECYTIYDGGADMDYPYDDHHQVILQSGNGNALTLRGKIDMGDNDHLYMYDGKTGSWLNGYGRDDNFAITVPSGRIILEYGSSGDTNTGLGFEFQVYFHTISNIQVLLKTDTTCRLTWDDNSSATQWTCYYGIEKEHMDSVVTTVKSVHLTNLIYGKRYYVFFRNNAVPCGDTTWFDFCAGGDRCISFGDIYSCFATGYYGRFLSPDENRGLVDYGPDDINSRHTVIDDTLATDPRTGGQLRCVPPGYPESVRLGNWDIGGEAESLVYEFDVDTSKSEILLLRYAAVLENPNHSPAMQPRFRFAILNEGGGEINPECYSADFISSDELGWNLYHYDTNTVLWKDWTAIGVDLAPLHGQKIFVKLTTYDCNEMGHFGYAYFTLECVEKEMNPSECGVVHSNTFRAPEGFRYEWYNIDSADVILSTAQTYSSNLNGIYKCRAHFLGSTSNDCYFEKTVVVGDIFPYANYTWQVIDTDGCDVVVQFHNISCVSLDPENTQLTSMECDAFEWDFGDGSVSYDKHPTHKFPSREFSIRLRASIAEGLCSDDTTQTIAMPSPCISYDTLWPNICEGDTFALRDSIYTTTGYYTVRTEYRPDSIVTSFVHLSVHHTLDTNLLGGICDDVPYTLFGFNESVAGDYVHAFTSVWGCDSIYRLHLETASSIDTSVTLHGCTPAGYTYRDTTFLASTLYTDSLLSQHACDSVVHLSVVITESYNFDRSDTICQGDIYTFGTRSLIDAGNYVDSLMSIDGCDSVENLQLTVFARFTTNLTEQICMNRTFSYGGNEYSAGLIVDSLMSVDQCDSVVYIDVQFFDTTFHARALASLDSIFWTGDGTLLASCRPMTLLLRDVSTSAASVRWYFGDGDSLNVGTSPTQPFLHSYTDSGLYNVMLVATSPDGCFDTASVTSVQVFPRPFVDFEWTPFNPTNIKPEADFVNLSTPLYLDIPVNQPDSLTYIWYFYHVSSDEDDPQDTSLLFEPHYQWPDDASLVGNHDVTLIASQTFVTLHFDTLVCVDTMTHPVEIVNIILQFPNAVTPNGDGINDTWRVVNLVEYNLYPVNRLRIYNRWGRLVYQRDNITSTDDDWNPNDCDCPDGTYFFRFDAQGEFGFVRHNGAIEVIR